MISLSLIPRSTIAAAAAGTLLSAGLAAALLLARNELADVRKDLALEKALRDRDAETFRAGQALATADHLQEIVRLKDLYGSLANEADNQNQRLRDDYDARVLRLPAIPAGAYFGGDAAAALPGAAGAPGADGSGGDSVLLARSDAQICADNTRRILAGHNWALGLASDNH